MLIQCEHCIKVKYTVLSCSTELRLYYNIENMEVKIIRENFFLVNKSCFSYLQVLTYSGVRIRHFMWMGVESFQVERLFLVKSNYF